MIGRLTAFTCLCLAAFDWPLPWLDRVGTAALGFAFLALAGTAGILAQRRPELAPEPEPMFAVDGEVGDQITDILERLGAYGAGGQ